MVPRPRKHGPSPFRGGQSRDPIRGEYARLQPAAPRQGGTRPIRGGSRGTQRPKRTRRLTGPLAPHLQRDGTRPGGKSTGRIGSGISAPLRLYPLRLGWLPLASIQGSHRPSSTASPERMRDPPDRVISSGEVENTRPAAGSTTRSFCSYAFAPQPHSEARPDELPHAPLAPRTPRRRRESAIRRAAPTALPAGASPI